MRLFIIDNYDSFTYNLVQYFGELGAEMVVRRNDVISVEEIVALKPDRICISPGPCTPNEAGISLDLIREMGATTPILGVCLGHQSIGAAFGGNIVKAPEIFHGKTSKINHDGSLLFSDIENSYEVVRYHSLIVDMNTLPEQLKVTATLEDNQNIIMAIEHKEKPIYGVQFHPESINTNNGKKLIKNFLRLK